MRKLELLIATMNQKDLKKYDEMNIRSDAIFLNQADKYDYIEKYIKNNKVKMITTKERGVGKNRNQALLVSTAEICLLSDDDMIYNDNYKEIVCEAFEKIPKADIIIFNIETIGKKVKRKKNYKIKRVNILNFQNYGAVRIAFRREEIIKKNLWFSILFGGGTKYSSGEDTLFLRDALRKKVKIYTYPKTIGTVKQETSTWFTGYNEKFFFDKGALLSNTFPRLKYLLAIFYFPWRFKKNTTLTINKTISLMLIGIKAYSRGYSYEEWIAKNKGAIKIEKRKNK